MLVSFFGGLRLGQVAPPEQVANMPLHVASLLDIAGMSMSNAGTAAISENAGSAAILLVHMAGRACDMNAIGRLAREHGLIAPPIRPHLMKAIQAPG